ncbi:hypothetical protein M407DRAFT_160717 [Tulasnella calospora MUT 4182]|uniref:Uncharacterized protein n=1 Tax=Tulasnella calospora MUT 4182 TaxID=1051891 RepID=A0A0C3KA41_9AGAM|nr:hypothetical protein M407DRAFT_160717 [Tulasnella calospora MUT 4182]
MTSDGFTMGASGIGPCDPAQVSRFLCKHYVVMVSKANRDELVEFCHLVVLLDLKNKSIPQDLGALVDCVMKNPQPNQVQEAVWKLKEYADSLRVCHHQELTSLTIPERHLLFSPIQEKPRALSQTPGDNQRK